MSLFSTDILFFFKDSDLNVRNDNEIQAFRFELMLQRSMNGGGGCGIKVIFFYPFLCHLSHSSEQLLFGFFHRQVFYI